MSRRRNKNKPRVQERALARAAEKVLQRTLQNSPNSNLPTIDFPSSVPSAISVASRSVSAYSGPVPPPAMLEEFDRIEPGRAAKLMQLAEDQSRHRMHLENFVIKSDVVRSWAGLVTGGILSAGIVTGGCILVATGHDWAGASIICSTLVSLAGVFVYGRKSQSEERKQKSKKS